MPMISSVADNRYFWNITSSVGNFSRNFGFKKSKQHSVKLRRSSNGDLFAEKRREASQLLPTKSSHVSTESSLSFVKTTLSLRLAFEEEREKVEEIILYNSVVVNFVCAEFECVSVKSKKKFSSK